MASGPTRADAQVWLRARIASLPPAQGASDWSRQLEISGGVLLVAGNNLMCWFVDPEGTLFEADRDSAVPRLERMPEDERSRSILAEAVKDIPELAPLLDPPEHPDGCLELVSSDGRWRARVHDDVDPEGGEVTTLELFDARTGRRTGLLDLRESGLRLQRFLGPRRLLMVCPDGQVEVDLDAPKPRRWVKAAAATAVAPSTAPTTGPTTAPPIAPTTVPTTEPPTAPTIAPPTAPTAPAPPFAGELTGERSLFAMFVFVWLAALPPLIPGVMLLESSGRDRLVALAWFALAITLSVGFVRVATRPRVVEITSAGVLCVFWGRRFALPLARVPAASVEELTVTREARFAVQGRVGGTPRMAARPDRWRIKARVAGGRRIDLGTTATAEDAETVRARVLSWNARA